MGPRTNVWGLHPVLRIAFTPDDLSRTRIASELDPTWELIGSLQLLQNREGAPVFDRWRRQVRQHLTHDGDRRGAVAATRKLATICPHAEYFPDFLTPAGSTADPEERFDAVQRTPAGRLRAELGMLATARPPPPWVDDLAAGTAVAMAELGTAMRLYWRAAIMPYLREISAGVAAERDRLLHLFMHQGLDGVLNDLDPGVRWRDSTLEVSYPCEQRLDLRGRGLALVPSFFCWRMPVSLADPTLPPVLVYPIRGHRPGFCADAARRGLDELERLLGPTRSSVLHATANGANTCELARRIGISPATASHHATILRNAGLISSHRRANVMLHELTPLGAALLDAPSGGFTEPTSIAAGENLGQRRRLRK